MRTCNTCAVRYPDGLEYCPKDGQRLAPASGDTMQMYDPLIGTTIDGRYAVEALLGEGGMGFVYAARHVHIDKRVALKILRKEAAVDQASAQRFIDEARAASKIGHQNIVDITDFGVLDDGHAYFVMEYLDGPTLAKLIGRSEPLPIDRAIGIAVQIARGLHAAHGKGIIHRDLKPDNIFVVNREADRAGGSTDLIKIVDFGIAKDLAANKKLTQVGMVLGTPEYISPEQATGSPSDHRVDVYALGCILYEMLTGSVPFKNDTAPKTLVAHVIEAPIAPSARRPDLKFPPALEAVVMKSLEKKPDDRYADMRFFMTALDEVATKLGGASGPRVLHSDAYAATAAAKPLPDPRAAALQKTLPPTEDKSLTRPPVATIVSPTLGAQKPTGWTTELGTELVPRVRTPKWVYALAAVAMLLAVMGAVAIRARRNAAVVTTPPPALAPVAPPLTEPAPAESPKKTTNTERNTVNVTIKSTPARASISIDGVGVGSTPFAGGLMVGHRRVALHADGYIDHEWDIDATKDAELDLDLKAATRKKHAPPVPTPTARHESPPPATHPANHGADRSTELRNPF